MEKCQDLGVPFVRTEVTKKLTSKGICSKNMVFRRNMKLKVVFLHLTLVNLLTKIRFFFNTIELIICICIRPILKFHVFVSEQYIDFKRGIYMRHNVHQRFWAYESSRSFGSRTINIYVMCWTLNENSIYFCMNICAMRGTFWALCKKYLDFLPIFVCWNLASVAIKIRCDNIDVYQKTGRQLGHTLVEIY